MQNYLYIHLAVNMIDNYFRVYPGEMRFIQELSQETTSMLSRIYRQSKHLKFDDVLIVQVVMQN